MDDEMNLIVREERYHLDCLRAREKLGHPVVVKKEGGRYGIYGCDAEIIAPLFDDNDEEDSPSDFDSHWLDTCLKFLGTHGFLTVSIMTRQDINVKEL